jgi:hypothetical protein
LSSFSSSYEVSEDQVLSSLETIFCVRIPGSNSSLELVSTFLQIFEDSESMTEPRLEDGTLDYPELISDILSQVLVNISQGKTKSYFFFILN